MAAMESTRTSTVSHENRQDKGLCKQWMIPADLMIGKIQHARTSLTCDLKGWNGLLVSMMRKRFFKAPKALSTVTLKLECLKLNNSLGLVG
jgi:hypothetical protein